jgi:branched-chain amino acid transport system substrate-binding protein
LRRLLFALALALVAGLPARAADPPFEIPVITSLTGPIAFLGTEAARGLGMVETIVNRQGGINGRPIKFVINDDQSNPQISNQLMSQARARGANIVLDAAALSSCLAANTLVGKDGPVLFCTTSGVHPAPGSFLFVTVPSTVFQYDMAVRYYRLRGFTKIALIATTDATGQDTEKYIDAAAAQPENRGVTIVNHEHLNIGDLSAAAQIERIRSTGAQAVVAGTTGAAYGTILRGMRDAGLNLPIISSGGNLSYKQMEAFQANMPQSDVLVMGFPAFAPELATQAGVRTAVVQMLDAMRANGVARPEIGGVIAWDAAFVMVDALRKKGVNASAEQLRSYINQLKGYPGVFGVLDYRAVPQFGVSKDWIVVLRWDAKSDNFVGVSKPGGEPVKR